MSVKPGYRTTELLVTLLTGVGSWLAEWQGSLSPKWAALATTISAAAYALSRAITKHGVATSGRVVVPVAPAAAAPAAAPTTPVQQV
jgi:hypothetical protein